MKKKNVIFFMAMFAVFLMFASCNNVSAQIGEPLSRTGWFLITWGDSHDGSGEIRYTLTNDDGQTSELSLHETVVKSLGGVLFFNRKHVTVQGYLGFSGSERGGTEVLDVTSMHITSSPQSAIEPDITPAVSGSKPWVTIMCKFSDKIDEPNDLAYFQGMYANTKP